MRSLITKWLLLGVLAVLTLSLISCGSDGSGENDEDGGSTPIPLSFTDNGNGIITDDITRLMWQKEEDGVGYTWDEAVGSAGLGVCEGLELGGYSDWRVPSVQELLTIVVYERAEPAIHTTYFPKTMNAHYWTATQYVGPHDQAYHVEFRYGQHRPGGKGIRYFVRCVRGSRLPSSSFSDNADGTVTNTLTGHMWQQDTGPNLLLSDGKKYCSNLALGGYGDWRMPTIRELLTLVEYTADDPTIDTLFFPDTHSSVNPPYYITSIVRPSGYGTWSLCFHFGSTHSNGDGIGLIRCMRDE